MKTCYLLTAVLAASSWRLLAFLIITIYSLRRSLILYWTSFLHSFTELLVGIEFVSIQIYIWFKQPNFYRIAICFGLFSPYLYFLSWYSGILSWPVSISQFVKYNLYIIWAETTWMEWGLNSQHSTHWIDSQCMAVTCLHHSLHRISWSQDGQLPLHSPGRHSSCALISQLLADTPCRKQSNIVQAWLNSTVRNHISTVFMFFSAVSNVLCFYISSKRFYTLNTVHLPLQS